MSETWSAYNFNHTTGVNISYLFYAHHYVKMLVLIELASGSYCIYCNLLFLTEGDQPWDFFGKNDAKAETPVLWPPHAKSWLIGKEWCWEGLGAGGEGDDRGWDGWMTSLTRWTWVSVNSGSWWWTGRPGVLRFMGSQRVGHDWATELNWTE